MKQYTGEPTYYARLQVKTANGWKVRYFKYYKPEDFGKFLCKYYKNKEYEWEEINKQSMQMLIKVYHEEFKTIS